jgi:phage tail sheath protein FI
MLGLASNSAPGVYFEFVDTSARGISAVPTDIAGFVGIAERGPVDTPTAINSWEQFEAVFGSFILSGFLAYSVNAFFQNGGRRCHIVRVADPTKVTTAGCALLGQDGTPTLRLSAISPGAWGNRLSVTVGRSSPGSTLSAAIQPADRWSTIVRSVAGFGGGAVVRLFQDAAVAIESYRVVTRVEAPLYQVWWHAALDTAFDITSPIYLEVLEFSLSVSQAGQIKEVYSRLSLVRDHPAYVGKILGDVGAPDSGIPALVGERPSQWIAIHDPDPIGIAELDDPSPTFPGRLPMIGEVRPDGGADGISGLTPDDFTGDQWSPEKRGLRCFEDVEEVAIVAIPDCLIQPPPATTYAPLPPPPPPDPCPVPVVPAVGPAVYTPPAMEAPPEFSPEEVYHIQRALVDQCEQLRNRIAVLDAPKAKGRGEAIDVSEIRGWRQRFDSKYAALYYPWLVVDDNLRLGGALTRAIPPSGHVVGLYARTDLSRGVHWAPANEALNWVRDTSVSVDAEIQASLNPLGIDCIRAFPGRGIRVFGGRTVSSDPDWRFVNVRRLMMMIEAACQQALQWAVFEPNGAYLREMVRISLGAFLTAVWRQGALVGATASEAFYVKCDEVNNPPAVSELGELIAEVGVAPVRPAEFVIFRVGRADDELQVSE